METMEQTSVVENEQDSASESDESSVYDSVPVTRRAAPSVRVRGYWIFLWCQSGRASRRWVIPIESRQECRTVRATMREVGERMFRLLDPKKAMRWTLQGKRSTLEVAWVADAILPSTLRDYVVDGTHADPVAWAMRNALEKWWAWHRAENIIEATLYALPRRTSRLHSSTIHELPCANAGWFVCALAVVRARGRVLDPQRAGRGSVVDARARVRSSVTQTRFLPYCARYTRAEAVGRAGTRCS